jgi:hypothetical protein
MIGNIGVTGATPPGVAGVVPAGGGISGVTPGVGGVVPGGIVTGTPGKRGAVISIVPMSAMFLGILGAVITNSPRSVVAPFVPAPLYVPPACVVTLPLLSATTLLPSAFSVNQDPSSNLYVVLPLPLE